MPFPQTLFCIQKKSQNQKLKIKKNNTSFSCKLLINTWSTRLPSNFLILNTFAA